MLFLLIILFILFLFFVSSSSYSSLFLLCYSSSSHPPNRSLLRLLLFLYLISSCSSSSFFLLYSSSSSSSHPPHFCFCFCFVPCPYIILFLHIVLFNLSRLHSVRTLYPRLYLFYSDVELSYLLFEDLLLLCLLLLKWCIMLLSLRQCGPVVAVSIGWKTKSALMLLLVAALNNEMMFDFFVGNRIMQQYNCLVG